MYKKVFMVLTAGIFIAGIGHAYNLVCKEGFVKETYERCYNKRIYDKISSSPNGELSACR